MSRKIKKERETRLNKEPGLPILRSIKKTVKMGRTRIEISSKEVIERSPVLMEVIGGVLQEECEALYT